MCFLFYGVKTSKAAKKVLQLELEYAAFMDSTVLVRCVVKPVSCSVQWSARALAIELDKESVGQTPNFYIEATALHHGLFAFIKAFGMLEITMVQMYLKKVFLLDKFFDLPSKSLGYEIVNNTPIEAMHSSASDTESGTSGRIVVIRN